MVFRLPKTRGMLRREAANWLVRLQSGRDPDVERKFQRWRDSDPRHSDAFDRVNRTYQDAALLRGSATAAAEQHQAAIRRPEWNMRPALAAVVAVVLLVPLGLLVSRGGGFPFAGTDAAMLMTRVGEIRQVELADGSKITLDTATKLDVEIGRSRRSAHLRYGRARFQIAQAGAPFVIETDSASVSAQQGVIDVAQIGSDGRVQVLAGAADVRGADPARASPVAVGAGEGVTVNSSGAERTSEPTPRSDWTHGMLQFDGTPLAAAVALANRYWERHIVLADDPGAMRVTGAFRAGDTTGLARALAAAFRLSLEQRADGALVLSRRTSSNLPNKRGG